MTEPAEILPVADAAPAWRAALTESIENTIATQIADLSEQFDSCLHELRAARTEIEEYSAYCARNGLHVDGPVLAQLITSTQQVRLRLIREQRSLVNMSLVDSAAELNAAEAVLRFGQASLAYVRNSL